MNGAAAREDLVECYVVGNDAMIEYWQSIYAPMIIAALEHGPDGNTLEDIREDLMCGSMLVNISVGSRICGVAVLDVVRQREERFLHVHTLTGGDMARWLPDFIEFLRFLRQGLDCDAVSLVGRKGWHKVLQQFGFKTKHVMMQLED